jgi:hypothetical protein
MTISRKQKINGGVLYDKNHHLLDKQLPYNNGHVNISTFMSLKKFGKLRTFNTGTKGGLFFTLTFDDDVTNGYGEKVNSILIKMIPVNTTIVSNNTFGDNFNFGIFTSRVTSKQNAENEIFVSQQMSETEVSPYIISTEVLKYIPTVRGGRPPLKLDVTAPYEPPPGYMEGYAATMASGEDARNLSETQYNLSLLQTKNIELFTDANQYLLLSNIVNDTIPIGDSIVNDTITIEESIVKDTKTIVENIVNFLISDTNHELHVIYMEYINVPNVTDVDYRQCSEVLTTMFEKTGFVHNDFHLRNFIQDNHNKHFVIDFGLARKLPEEFKHLYDQLQFNFANEDLRIMQRFFVSVLNFVYLINKDTFNMPLQYQWIIEQFKILSPQERRVLTTLNQTHILNTIKQTINLVTNDTNLVDVIQNELIDVATLLELYDFNRLPIQTSSLEPSLSTLHVSTPAREPFFFPSESSLPPVPNSSGFNGGFKIHRQTKQKRQQKKRRKTQRKKKHTAFRR